MDLGLFNKKAEPRGEHGTLIGNWVEERALMHTTGHTRHYELALEKQSFTRTNDRTIAHSDNMDSRLKESTTHATYRAPPSGSFQPKLYNQTGSHWHHDDATSSALEEKLNHNKPLTEEEKEILRNNLTSDPAHTKPHHSSQALGQIIKKKNNISNISFGSYNAPLSTTSNSSYLPKELLHASPSASPSSSSSSFSSSSFTQPARVPASQRPFPDTIATGGRVISKLDRPYVDFS